LERVSAWIISRRESFANENDILCFLAFGLYEFGAGCGLIGNSGGAIFFNKYN